MIVVFVCSVIHLVCTKNLLRRWRFLLLTIIEGFFMNTNILNFGAKFPR